MKKIIISAAVAAMALTTTASALEDIKVDGQAKLWYEASTVIGGDNDLFSKYGAAGSVVFKLGVTGKQGDVGFGATLYQVSTMGLEGILVHQVVTTAAANQDLYTGEAYVTFPAGDKTSVKFGKQELDTPLMFTERWSPTPNTFNAGVVINNSFDNLTLVGAYVGQDNTGSGLASPGSFAVAGEVIRPVNAGINDFNNETFALGALYKNDAFSVNVWGYELASLAKAVWVDASMKVGPATVKAYASQIMSGGQTADALGITDDTTALALSAGMKVGSFNLFAAASNVSDDTAALHAANVSTGGKKSKLPTMAVYLDGRSVAAPGATSFKLKAATKVAGFGLALQGVMVNNDNGVFTDVVGQGGDSASEVDLIVTKKVGDVNLKTIVMQRMTDSAPTLAEYKESATHVRLVATVNF